MFSYLARHRSRSMNTRSWAIPSDYFASRKCAEDFPFSSGGPEARVVALATPNHDGPATFCSQVHRGGASVFCHSYRRNNVRNSFKRGARSCMQGQCPVCTRARHAWLNEPRPGSARKAPVDLVVVSAFGEPLQQRCAR